MAGCRCLTLKISWMIKTTTKKECKEWKRFVGEENELSFRHATLEAALPVKMLCDAGNADLGLRRNTAWNTFSTYARLKPREWMRIWISLSEEEVRLSKCTQCKRKPKTGPWRAQDLRDAHLYESVCTQCYVAFYHYLLAAWKHTVSPSRLKT